MKYVSTVLILIFFALAAWSQPGTLKESFSSDGIFTQDISDEDEVQGIAFFDDGSFIAVGYLFDGDYDGLITKVSADGNIVWTKTIDVSGNGLNDFFQSVVVIDNNIYVQSNSFNSAKGGIEIVLFRYNSDGVLDTSFGDNGRSSYFTGQGIGAFEMEIDDQENIYIIGRTLGFFAAEEDGVVVKVNKDGELDLNFGSGGFSVQAIGSFRTGFLDGTIINNELYVVGWWHDTGTAVAIDENGVLIKIKEDGTRDLAFGDQGIINYDFDNGDIVNDVQQHGPNHLVMLATSGSPDDMRVLRFDLNGSVDFDFAEKGIRSIDLGNDDDAVNFLVRDDLGIYVCGSVNSEEDFAVVSLTMSGQIDTGFGDDGFLVVDIEGNDNLSEAVLLPNGDILLGGESNEDVDGDVALVLVQGYSTCTNISVEESIENCNSVTFDGQVYTESGTYPLTYKKADGCDSIVNLRVNILESSSSTVSLEGCQSVEINGDTFTESGDYMQTLVNAAGCDSIVNLQVSILGVTSNSISREDCDPITVNDQTYTESGDFTQTLMNAAGCDSILSISILINAPTFETIEEASCEAIEINGETYSESGTYTQMYTSQNGCDSTLTILVEIGEVSAEVSLSDDTLISLNSAGSYQWIDCANGLPIEGATAATFIPESSGEYQLELTNGECSDLSDCVMVNITSSLPDIVENEISVFPNPSSNLINVGGISDQVNRLEIMDMLGRRMTSEEVNGRANTALDISTLRDGTYFLILGGENGIRVAKRFIKVSE